MCLKKVQGRYDFSHWKFIRMSWGSFPDLLVLRLVVVPISHFGIGGAVMGL